MAKKNFRIGSTTLNHQIFRQYFGVVFHKFTAPHTHTKKNTTKKTTKTKKNRHQDQSHNPPPCMHG